MYYRRRIFNHLIDNAENYDRVIHQGVQAYNNYKKNWQYIGHAAGVRNAAEGRYRIEKGK